MDVGVAVKARVDREDELLEMASTGKVLLVDTKETAEVIPFARWVAFGLFHTCHFLIRKYIRITTVFSYPMINSFGYDGTEKGKAFAFEIFSPIPPSKRNFLHLHFYKCYLLRTLWALK